MRRIVVRSETLDARAWSAPTLLKQLIAGNCDNDVMTIIIRPEHEVLIAQAMQSGAYQNADAVIDRALEVLRSEDDWLDANKEAVGEKIERAFGRFERGEFFSAQESKADMERRKADWLRERGR